MLTNCSHVYSDEEINDICMTHVVKAIESKNHQNIKDLFAYDKINNISSFDEDIDELLDYYSGTSTNLKRCGSSSSGSKNDGYKQKFYRIKYDITTTTNKYRLFVKLCTYNNRFEDMVGIWSLYILEFDKDHNSKYCYGGDQLDTVGINIGKNQDKFEDEE